MLTRARRGHTILEMLMSLILMAIAIAVAAGFAFRQQRFHRDVVAAAERIEQLGQAASLIPIALRSIAPGDGDIPAGGARDTSLEFRATIATGILCDSSHGSLVLAPAHTAAPVLSSVLTRPDVGDTAWVITAGDTTETWTPRSIAAVADTSVACTIGGAAQWAGAKLPTLVIRLTGALPAGSGAPIRVTRTWRYSLYKASDGAWYLGAKDWNATSARFNTIQPVDGPFLSALAGGLVFRYYDSVGVAIPSATADPRGIALIQVSVRVDTVLAGHYRHAIGVAGTGAISIALRNRSR